MDYKVKLAWLRFFRVLIAFVLAYLVKYFTELITPLQLPFWVIPPLQAILSAVAKWVREKWQVELPF